MHAIDPGDLSLSPGLLIGTHKDKVPKREDHKAIIQLLLQTFNGHPVWRRVVNAHCTLPSTWMGWAWNMAGSVTETMLCPLKRAKKEVGEVGENMPRPLKRAKKEGGEVGDLRGGRGNGVTENEGGKGGRRSREDTLGSLHFSPVDNTQGISDPVAGQVRSVIQSCLAEEEYVRRYVPFAWMKVRDRLMGLVSPSGKVEYSIPLTKVLELARKCGLPTMDLQFEAEVLLMLRLYHQLGVLMHHDTPSLWHLINLDPASFLVDPASRVICNHCFHELAVHKAAKAHRDFHHLNDQLCLSAQLDTRLLPILWQDCYNHVAELQLLMVKYGLMVPLLEYGGDVIGNGGASRF